MNFFLSPLNLLIFLFSLFSIKSKLVIEYFVSPFCGILIKIWYEFSCSNWKSGYCLYILFVISNFFGFILNNPILFLNLFWNISNLFKFNPSYTILVGKRFSFTLWKINSTDYSFLLWSI